MFTIRIYMGDLTKQAQLLKKCVKLAVYIRSGREFVSILTMQPNNVLEKGAFFGRVSEQGKQYMIWFLRQTDIFCLWTR